MVEHPSAQEAEARRIMSGSQPGLYSETLSHKKRKERKGKGKEKRKEGR
jgi:hypothetical protein